MHNSSFSSVGRFVCVDGARHRIYVDPELPFWFVPSPAGDKVLRHRADGAPVEEIARRLADQAGRPLAACIEDVESLLRLVELPRPAAYTGRNGRELEQLSELWFHLTDECNSRCGHCLFSENLGSAWI